MIVYQSSLAEDETIEVQTEGFKDILERMVDPAIEMCMTSSEEKQKLKPSWDRSVFVLNTLSYIQVRCYHLFPLYVIKSMCFRAC